MYSTLPLPAAAPLELETSARLSREKCLRRDFRRTRSTLDAIDSLPNSNLRHVLRITLLSPTPTFHRNTFRKVFEITNVLQYFFIILRFLKIANSTRKFDFYYLTFVL